MGLKIMQYRAKIIGGSLEIKNRDGGGTEVLFRLTQYFT